MDAFIKAVAAAGGATRLAAILGVAASAPSMWRTRGLVPTERCPAIERACAGRVTCEDLRPDVTWLRVPDADWPHPDGRPCIDVAGPTRAAGAVQAVEAAVNHA